MALHMSWSLAFVEHGGIFAVFATERASPMPVPSHPLAYKISIIQL